MKRSRIAIFFLLLSYFSFSSLHAKQVIMVYPSDIEGLQIKIDSSWQCTYDLNDALEIAKSANDSTVIIYLSEGTHYLKETVFIKGSDFKNKTLILSSCPGNKAVISGGKKLNLNWQAIKGKKYLKAIVKDGDFDQLFINGERRILARYPDYKEGERMNSLAGVDVLSPKRVRSWKDPEGGFIHALDKHGWGSVHYRITGKSGGKVVYEGGFQNNRLTEMHPKYRYVENIFEELDAPGEWFFDKKNSILYYYPLENEKMDGSEKIEIAQLPSLIHVVGEEENPIKNIIIENLSFIHTSRTFMNEYEPLTRSDWRIHRDAAVFLEFAEDCSVKNCKFFQLGGNALFISKYAFACNVSGNHIHHIGASAVCVVGDTSCVRSPSFAYEQFVPFDNLDKTPGPHNAFYPRQCTLKNNLIHDLGEIEKQVAGIQIQLASQIHVVHNTIYNVPRAAINIGDGAFGGHLIEYNDAFSTVLETSDHGTFNSWGRDRFWHPSYLTMDTLTTKHPELILLDALYTTIIRNNRFRCDHGWDIDLDDGSSNYHIYNNLCLSGGIKLREGFFRKVENNILINNTLHPHLWFKNSGDIVQRNIMMDTYKPIRVSEWGKSVDYNFFFTCLSLDSIHKFGTDSHSIVGSLDFKNPMEGDFTLDNDSAALMVGFENFSMDRFGVYSSSLKMLSRMCEIPPLKIMDDKFETEKVYNWLEASVRNVRGLDDRSAFGLPDEKGVIILAIHENSPLRKFGLQPNDVIRSINGASIDSIEDLFKITKKRAKTWEIMLYRNQKLERIKIVME